MKLPTPGLALVCVVFSSTVLSAQAKRAAFLPKHQPLAQSARGVAQAPPTPQPPKPTPKPAPKATASAPPAPAPARPAPSRATMAVLVTDRSGDPIEGVAVGVTGPADREAKSDVGGNVLLRNMGEGTYRLRFEHPKFVMLERDVTMQAGKALRTSVALSPATAPREDRDELAPKDKPSAPPPPPAPALPPPGSQPATSLSIPEVFETNPIGREPSRNTAVGCAGVAAATLIQVREPLQEHAHDDADEALYVVAGEGIQRVSGRDVALTAGTFAMVPRGTPHAITRQGSRVLVLLSVLSGPPCAAG